MHDIDLMADLNAQDDDRLGWSTLADASEAAKVRPGVMLLAGHRYGAAVVRVVAVDDDGQVHFTILPRSVEKNRHLLNRTVAWRLVMSAGLSADHCSLAGTGCILKGTKPRPNGALTWPNAAGSAPAPTRRTG